jgi:dimethylaniline monooxygenase (N-oxide forming)
MGSWLTLAYREEDIGGTFKYRSYENAELVSSKQLTAFSDHRFPLDTPDHVSLPTYVDYLKSYIARFELGPYIKLNCPVTNVSPLKENQKWKHRVKYIDSGSAGEERVFDCSHVAICTGLHVQPNIPSIPGLENVQGDVFHSSLYKGRSQVAGRNVLILGCGETAMGELLSQFTPTNLMRTLRHRIRVDQSKCKICNYVLSYGLLIVSETG